MSSRPIHEHTAWLRDALAGVAARVDSAVVDPDTVVITTLGAIGGRMDRTCDRCGTYVPRGRAFFPAMIPARRDLLVIVGLCHTCRNAEHAGGACDECDAVKDGAQ